MSRGHTEKKQNGPQLPFSPTRSPEANTGCIKLQTAPAFFTTCCSHASNRPQGPLRAAGFSRDKLLFICVPIWLKHWLLTALFPKQHHLSCPLGKR